jgi:hypothetical protein
MELRMPDPTEIARNLVFALRKIEANADGALEHGNANAALQAIRESAGGCRAPTKDAALRQGLTRPRSYGCPSMVAADLS